MSDDESDDRIQHGHKRKISQIIESDDPSSSADGPESPVIGSFGRRLKRRNRTRPVIPSDSEESDCGSPIGAHRRKRVPQINSDSGESVLDTSGSSIVKRVRGPGRVLSDSENDEDKNDADSQWETDTSSGSDEEAENEKTKNEEAAANNVDSDSSDGTSEKCPICLLSFKSQEVGSPESCDHLFCAECIQEWSKTMNTCPVDRQKFTIVLVRKDITADKIIRQIPIQPPSPQNDIEIIEDPTFCEICGSSDREDRMLLCDECDLGFHLECLTPPLEDVPSGNWYCPDCEGFSPTAIFDNYVSHLQYNNRRERDIFSRNNIFSRIARTRHNERLRSRIRNNRSINTISIGDNREDLNTPSSSRMASESLNVSSTSAGAGAGASLTNRRQPAKKTKKKRKKKNKTKQRYRIVYEYDEATGETIPIKKRMRKKRSRRRIVMKPKSVKKRLALHLGICSMSSVPQSIPEMKIQMGPYKEKVGQARFQAGVLPTLSLFGNPDELDYFSASEEESGLSVGGLGVMTRGRVPNQSDVSIIHRIARRKAALINPVVSSSTDILDSILDTQSKFHSKNTVFSLDENGKFKMNNKSNKNNKNNNNNNNNSAEFKDYEKAIKKQPGYSNGNAPSSTNNYNSGYQNSSNTNYNYAPPPHYSGLRPNPPPSFNYSYFPPPNYGGHDVPQDYTQRTLGGGCNYPPPDDPEKDEKNKNPTVDSEDVDIYSDIEGDGVSTSQMDEDLFLRPPPTPPVLRTPPAVYDDDNDRDSDPDMVIDTDKVEPEKYDPLACEDSDEDMAEGEEQVSSTVTEMIEEKQASTSFDRGENISDIQIETVQSTQMFDKKQDDDSRSADGDHDQDDDSEDGCPNFSIYSKESMNMAIKTDIAMMQQELNNQVGEVSSTPTAEARPNETCEKDDGQEIPEKVIESSRNEITPESNQKENDGDIEKAARKSTWSDEELGELPEGRELSEEPITEPPKILEKSTESWSTDEAEEVKTPPRTPTPKASIGDQKTKAKKACWSDDDEASPIAGKSKPARRSEWSDEEPEISVRSQKKSQGSGGGAGGLYSDSEDENIVKKDSNLKLTDICAMTEEISEEERSYTPCLDEKVSKSREGIEGLDTEMISDEDRNDFDESHDLKTLSDGDALEINAKECELDFTRPEDYEEGEIVDKMKDQSSSGNPEKVAEEPVEKQPRQKESRKETEHEEIDHQNTEPFKKLSKSNKERNYREKDKDKENHNSSKERNKEKSDRDFRKDKRREKRRELERYDVRALIAEKPRRVKDKFGRDVRKSPTRSRSKSHTPQLPPRRSPSRSRVSPMRRIRRERSREIRSLTHSRSRSPRRTSRSKIKKKNVRSSSKGRSKRRKSRDKSKKAKKTRSLSRNRSVTPRRRRRREEREPREIEWNDNQNREWTPSLSPSWTPPRMTDVMQPHNLTVILPNDANKKKKEKRKKTDKRNSDRGRKRRRIDRTPPPSKEVFASGDNILVSVSFNKENETRDIITTAKRREEEKRKKEKRKRLNRKNADVSGLKPVAIIDLERSPFRVISSPKDIIVLTDSENENIDAATMNTSVNSSQQVASPERCPNNYLTGPKTPPEPQIKFSLNTKQSQLRAINNPLGEPDDLENDMDVQDELEERLNENIYNKGPNTPPEPPNSPPSSPDAYDPFEPTKSRSPTPEPLAVNPPNSEPVLEETREQVLLIESIRTGISEIMDNKATGLPLLSDSPDILNSHTPPVSEVQPADSQSSLRPATPDSNFEKSPDVSVVITEPSQPQSPSFTSVTPKTVAQAPPFSSGQNNLVTSTPVSSSLVPTRINILNNTVITSVATPQRVAPTSVAKTSPVKSTTAPVKSTAVKSTPVKTTTPKTVVKTTPRKVTNTNRSIVNEVTELLDFDSPYSPGSSDYEDLFEPPPEIVTKPKGKTNSKSPSKVQNIFDALFGSGSTNKSTKATRTEKGHKHKKISVTPQKGAKMVGVKLDEDSLKILDDLPSSAVEMQVKDKYLKKLYRQERVVEEVKLVLKPYYNKKRINKEEYKDIMRRAVPKICHNKNGEINPTKIKSLIEAYVKKIRHNKKVTSSSNVNSQKA